MNNTEFPAAIKIITKELYIDDRNSPFDRYGYIADVHGITVQNIRQALLCAYISGLIQGKNEPDYKIPADPIY